MDPTRPHPLPYRLLACTAGLCLALGAIPLAAVESPPMVAPLITDGTGVRVIEGQLHDRAPERAPAPSRSLPTGRVDRPPAYVSAVRTELIGDRDRDGFYRGFAVTIDVDTDYGDLEVYANVYLHRSGRPSKPLHTTRDFRIHGGSSRDEYRVEVELLDGFGTGHYDLSIDIHDSYDHWRLDSVGAREFRNLAGLPLESGSHYPANDDILVVEYTGSLAWTWLLALSLAIGLRRRIRRDPDAGAAGTPA